MVEFLIVQTTAKRHESKIKKGKINQQMILENNRKIKVYNRKYKTYHGHYLKIDRWAIMILNDMLC